MIFLKKIDRLVLKLYALKKHVFVNNKRTVIARNFFLENIGILILFQMLPIRFKYLDPIIKKKSKINFENIENSK